ncbi:hypothetical protein ACWDPI_23435, partial [Streptomyces zhihengii]
IEWEKLYKAKYGPEISHLGTQEITGKLQPRLIQFKVGTGGEAVEYVGEWDFPLNKLLHKALDIYMSRR